MDNICVSCGAIIPEGRQICPKCEKEEFAIRPIKKYSERPLGIWGKKKRQKSAKLSKGGYNG